MDDLKSRPPECRDRCQVMQCEGSGCRFLHDEAADHIADAGKVIDPPEKKEGRHARNRT